MVFIKDSQGRVLAKDDDVQECWSRSERAMTLRQMTEQVIATLEDAETTTATGRGAKSSKRLLTRWRLR